jgi:hypothetical protein
MLTDELQPDIANLSRLDNCAIPKFDAARRIKLPPVVGDDDSFAILKLHTASKLNELLRDEVNLNRDTMIVLEKLIRTLPILQTTNDPALQIDADDGDCAMRQDGDGLYIAKL